MKKKFLALVMTLSMVLSLVPMTALAAEGDKVDTVAAESQSAGEDANGGKQESGSNTGANNASGGDNTDTSDTNTNTNNKDEGKDSGSENTDGTTGPSKPDAGTTEGDDTGKVAKNIDTNAKYETLDAAIAEAQNNDTIQLLGDCILENGITLDSKSLTIQGNDDAEQTITLKNAGMYAKQGTLTFKNCTLDIIAGTHLGPEKSGATANLMNGADLVFDNANVTLKSDDSKASHGLYLYKNSNLYLMNGSSLLVTGYNGSASSGIYADESEFEGQPNRIIKVENYSKITVENCGWNGMTIDPINMEIADYSEVNIQKCGATGGRGGLGCYDGKLTITNHSKLITDNNKGAYNGMRWGAFVKELYVDGTSEISSCKNSGHGLEIGGTGEILSGAKITLEGNTESGLVSYTGSNYWFGNVKVEEGANVEIHKNAHGIYVMPGGELDMQTGNVTLNTGSEYGGGLWNKGGTVVLGSNVALYNNHASQYGDDIYSAGATYRNKEYNATITFNEVGEDWKLDDCTPEHPILGWYKDGMESNGDTSLKRWNVHGEAYYAEEYTAPATEVTEALALKAAHPKMYSVIYSVSGEIPAGYETPAQKYYKDPFEYTVENVPSSIPGTKDGVNGTYSFTGWKTKSGEIVTGPQKLTEDTTLYGEWTFTKKSSSGGHRPSNPTVTIPDDVPTGLDLKNHYGYIIGYPVDYYTGKPTTDQTKKPVRPEGKITRAEVATIYFRMLTDENRAANWNQVSGFSDVKSSAWYNNAISTLTKAGILKGYEDGTFQPNGYITRAEFATIAIRFFSGVYEGEDLFPDIKGHWAEDYINNAANKGLVKGYEDGTFGPDRYITRAEAVTLVNRTLNRHPHNDGLHKDMLVWPDNMDTSKWYYADMQEATNSHEPDKNKTTADKEYWGKMLPIRDWEALEKEWSNANSAPGEGEVV